MLDLMKIARTEHEEGDLFALLQQHFAPTDVRPQGHPQAVIWRGGKHDGKVQPVAHALTDKYALLGTLMAADVLGLPFYAVPMWAQYRHDRNLEPLAWFGNMPCTAIKWSTAGDAYVRDGRGGRCVVKGKSGNAPLRTQAGVYCNVRPYGCITIVRCMPCLPYSQAREKFRVNEQGVIHSEMNTPGMQMAYAGRHFLKLVHESGRLGRIAFKPTQAMEDGVNAGLLQWLLEGTRFKVGRRYAVNYLDEQRENVARITKLLPPDFKRGMESWGGQIEQHISDTNYGLLLWDLIEQRDCIVLATDLDGDRLTDLLADVSDPLRNFAGRVAKHAGAGAADTAALWREMGYTTGNGRDMTSVMHRMSGPPIHEQTLGSADAMLLRLLEGDESQGGTKRPYDPRIHFVLIRAAYRDANPQNAALHEWLDAALARFDEVYAGERPGFLQGYAQLKEAIAPWGA